MVGGLLGFLFTIVNLPAVSISVLVASALAPCVYSLVVYKQMERRVEL
jgi:hypothetical protein